MQYSFDFSEKPATPNLNLNHLDYKQLSGFAEFTEQLINFNEKYDMNLVATKSSRWQPGTYDKIKANIDSIIYPHWKKRRGANSINKLLERNNWRYQNFQDELKTLDNKLYRYRKEGIELYTDDDLKKAVQLIEQYSQPLEARELSALLTELHLLTKQRKENQVSLDLAFELYGRRLEKYPADIVREVLSKWWDQSKWWPSWQELKVEIDWRDKRGKLKSEIEAKLLKQQLKELRA